MSGIRDDAFWADQDDHAMACALYGDCIFDIVKEGSLALEATWERTAQPFGSLLATASKTGIFGLGPRLDQKWLRYVIFGPPKNWPRGLTREEQKVLVLARSNAGWLSDQSLGNKVDPMTGYDGAYTKESEEATLAALKKFAALYAKFVARPMWADYEKISRIYAVKIAPLCQEKYGEACSLDEAKEMFQGDLERGWKMKTLPIGAVSYHVFSAFLDWVAV